MNSEILSIETARMIARFEKEIAELQTTVNNYKQENERLQTELNSYKSRNIIEKSCEKQDN